MRGDEAKASTRTAGWPLMLTGAICGGLLIGLYIYEERLDPEAAAAAAARPATRADIGGPEVERHRPHRPGECPDCDRYRDWEARPPVSPPSAE